MKKIIVIIILLFSLALPGVSVAGSQSVLIQNATVMTASDLGILENTDLLIENGLIAAIGKQLTANDAEIIDASNMIVTPGLIAPHSQLGLVEIELEQQTRDDSTDHYSAGFSIANAFNPSSTLIPYNRSGGITSAIVVPASAKTNFSGMASVFNLDGKLLTQPIAQDIAMVMNYGAESDSRASQILLLEDAFEKAVRFKRNKASILRGNYFDYGVYTIRDLEAIMRVLDKDIPLLVRSNRAQDLLTMIAIAKKYRIKMVFYGAKEAWRIADVLAREGIPVILDPMDNIPDSFDAIAARMDNAALLYAAGVKILITSQSTHNSYLSRQGAGNAVAYGLPQDEALKALTINVADIFGLSKERGSIEVGKSADLVIWDGNPLEVSSFATAVIIEGRSISLISRPRRLRDKYLIELGLK